MEIHIARDGKNFGPYSIGEVNDYLGTGFLKPDDLAWHNGLTNWQALSTIQGVNAAASTRRPPPPPPTGTTATPISTTSKKPDTYLVSSILVTLLCCLPLGIVAIVYAVQVDSKWSAGDHQGAAASSASAKMWCSIAAGLGLLVTGLWLLVLIIGGVAN